MDDKLRQELTILVKTLRNPASWPPDFKWDFHYCHSCALELYALSSRRDPSQLPDEVLKLFVSPEPYHPSWKRAPLSDNVWDISPEEVAKKLEEICAKG